MTLVAIISGYIGYLGLSSFMVMLFVDRKIAPEWIEKLIIWCFIGWIPVTMMALIVLQTFFMSKWQFCGLGDPIFELSW